MTAPSRDLHRGATVVLDTDLTFGGRKLRGQRGTVKHISRGHVLFVCTCNGGPLHALTCPVDMALTTAEAVRTSR